MLQHSKLSHLTSSNGAIFIYLYEEFGKDQAVYFILYILNFLIEMGIYIREIPLFHGIKSS